MDPNKVLAQIRHTIDTMRRPISHTTRAALSEQVVAQFEALDSHLTAGGTPPEAWREGPDAPELDDYEPLMLGRCARCGQDVTENAVLERGRYFHNACYFEPLGAPNPAQSELPDHDLTAAATVEHGEREV